ncbi:MAG: glucose 1-dehydrogenase [Carnobacterium sp.]|uniref:SDR family NAD(P)-dependent oxidoreductase n=1 Tax=Carnobacterium antarcticum TaxID=2126436 RepID=A0ABW4NNC3_9LACT|nr:MULTISPECIES: glucose 1-dehydrogenase [unclassified Carnobacterium]ALV22776.1 3-oxoacyl-[acyl-carrier protein] reductase [Carnobacterium sp. CP1]QQP70671.1 glucose 1-dehydrogenase [Carnobacterium sp. CS13]
MGRLENKVAIITGAANGMGAATASMFAKEGAKVVLTDLQEEKMQELVSVIKEKGGEAIAVKHNVASGADWDRVRDETLKAFGKIDVLINNAGITGDYTKSAELTDEEEWQKVIDINLKSVYLGVNRVIPIMKENGGGSIVNISSIAGLVGSGGPFSYTASKGGVRLLTKNVAFNYGPDHIRCNSIHPGTIKTPMSAPSLSIPAILDRMLQGIPLKYVGEADDIAYACVYLASDESNYVTGAELAVDGGYSAQ